MLYFIVDRSFAHKSCGNYREIEIYGYFIKRDFASGILDSKRCIIEMQQNDEGKYHIAALSCGLAPFMIR